MENKQKIDFLKYRNKAAILSLIIVVFSIVLWITPGLKKGVDFSGGTILHLEFTAPITDDVLRNIFKKDIDLEVVIQTAERVNVTDDMKKTSAAKGASFEKLVRTIFLTDKPGPGQKTYNEVKKGINDGLKKRDVKDSKDEFVTIKNTLSEESVGPAISQELTYQALTAIFISMFLILLYITIQFEFSFAVPAIIAIMHDTLGVLGFLILTGHEMNMIILAVMLTVVGYSINDTIVISDRIRENMKIMRKAKFADLVNISLNQTISRTIITTSSTLLPLITMAVWGGPVLKQFAVPMIFGSIIGTYSSIYVVSSLVITWKTREENKRLSRKRK